MSLSPVSVQKRIKDDQFIGDLMNLFERRKIAIGDPSSFENFASILASNDAFRSQLFTLCTAISHMSAEDLSGEQLLALVARALGGPGLPKRDGVVEIPDNMRSAFLSGYDAWSNRGSEPKEPLPWPAPKQSESRDEPLPPTHPGAAEPTAAKLTGPGMRTVQEALDIARERSLADHAEHPATRAGANTEGLTLSELKALLEEMEKRVSRLQPHLHDLTSAAPSPADLFARRATMREIDTTSSATPHASPLDDPASPLADTSSAQTVHRTSRPARINEAAFLARHAYLRPARQAAQESHPAGFASAPAAASLVTAAAANSAAPLLAATPAPAIGVIPEPAVALPAPTEAVAAPVLAAPVAAVPPAMVPTLPAVPSLFVVAARHDPPPYVPQVVDPVSLAIGRVRVTRRMAAGVLIGFAAFIFVVSGVAGLLVYPSLHPKSVNDYPDLRQPASPPSSAPNSAPAADSASTAQMILAAPGDPLLAPPAPRVSRSPALAAKAPAAVPRPGPAGVWPYNNQVTVRDVYAPPAPAAPSAAAARRVAPPAPPVYVPSSTLIAYALSSPQPSYPKDQPRGIAGTVVVQIAVSREGYVTDVRVVSGPVEMRPATVQAVQSWRFKPYLVNGTPAEVTTTLGFLFRGQ